jgi:hypothetical protein
LATTADTPDTGDDPGRRHVVVVDLPGRQWRQLEERGVGIKQRLDALAY